MDHRSGDSMCQQRKFQATLGKTTSVMGPTQYHIPSFSRHNTPLKIGAKITDVNPTTEMINLCDDTISTRRAATSEQERGRGRGEGKGGAKLYREGTVTGRILCIRVSL